MTTRNGEAPRYCQTCGALIPRGELSPRAYQRRLVCSIDCRTHVDKKQSNRDAAFARWAANRKKAQL